MAQAKLRIELYRSMIGSPEKLRRVVRGLGLRRINQVVERPDTPAIRGMVAKVPHLVRIREREEMAGRAPGRTS